MKKIMIVLLVFALMIAPLALGAEEYSGDPVGARSFPSEINLVKGAISADGVTPPTFFEKLFRAFGSGYDFTQKDDAEALKNNAASLSCEQTSYHGYYTYYEDGRNLAGQSCPVGSFIVYTYRDTTINPDDSHVIFDDAWEKTSTSDLPILTDYYVRNVIVNQGLTSTDGRKYIQYAYYCYDCNVDSYDGYMNIVAVEMVDGSSREFGDDYVVKVTTRATGGDVERFVLQTGLSKYGKTAGFSTTDIAQEFSSAVCGDYGTVGVDYNKPVKEGDFVVFRLRDNANKPVGTYNVPVYTFNNCNDKQKMDESGFTIKVTDSKKECFYCDAGVVKSVFKESCSTGQTTSKSDAEANCQAPQQKDCWTCVDDSPVPEFCDVVGSTVSQELACYTPPTQDCWVCEDDVAVPEYCDVVGSVPLKADACYDPRTYCEKNPQASECVCQTDPTNVACGVCEDPTYCQNFPEDPECTVCDVDCDLERNKDLDECGGFDWTLFGIIAGGLLVIILASIWAVVYMK